IGKAAAYAIASWERLTRFVEDARVPLDNNATERGIRGPVIERRNHFGSKSRRGTEVAAIFYTLVETAKLHGVDPAAYLRAALRRPGSTRGRASTYDGSHSADGARVPRQDASTSREGPRRRLHRSSQHEASRVEGVRHLAADVAVSRHRLGQPFGAE